MKMVSVSHELQPKDMHQERPILLGEQARLAADVTFSPVPDTGPSLVLPACPVAFLNTPIAKVVLLV